MLIKGKVLTVSMLFTFSIIIRDIKGISEVFLILSCLVLSSLLMKVE